MARTISVKRARSIDKEPYLKGLNVEQSATVLSPFSPLMVIAGAGSGKTKTLTARVAHMMQQGIPASAIMLLTFTNRAAANMIQRVEKQVGPESRRIQGGTFHSIAYRYLRQHATKLGYPERFTVLDRDDAESFMKSIIAEVSAQKSAHKMPRAKAMLKLMSYAINTHTHLNEVVLERAPQYLAVSEILAEICSLYIQRKIDRGFMDFDDLLINWFRLLDDSDTHSEMTRNVKAVLVDEYQDTNVLQAQIVDALVSKHRNITIVGDDAQSIYGFRGADVRNMLFFADRYPECATQTLTTNYRSSPEILSLANVTLENARYGFKKELRATRDAGEVPALVPCADSGIQASFIAQHILTLHQEEGVDFDDIAILYRAHAHSIDIQVELAREGIPFVVRSGLRFFEQAHIKDVLAFLRIVENPRDEISLARLARLSEGVGEVTASRFATYFRGALDHVQVQEKGGRRIRCVDALHNEDFQREIAALRARARKGLEKINRILEVLDRVSQSEKPSKCIDVVTAKEGFDYLSLLERKFDNPKDRKADIEQLADYAEGYESLTEFLNDLSLTQTAGVSAKDSGDEESSAVTLSTVHQAKGLEWRAVFIPALVEGMFPSEMALREGKAEEDERRLFYVAATRAEETLIMSYPQVKHLRDGTRVMTHPSRFIEEARDEDILDIWSLNIEDVELDGAENRLEGSGVARPTLMR